MRQLPKLEPAAGVAALGAAVLWLAGCGLFGHTVAADAERYYNFALGLSPKSKYTSFCSPAFVKSLPQRTLDLANEATGRATKANPSQKPVDPREIRSATKGNFALTAASNKAGFTLRSLGTTRWVRVGGRWYLYRGSDAELTAYGTFPLDLQLPPEDPTGPAARKLEQDEAH
jgi:hypothetical protein